MDDTQDAEDPRVYMAVMNDEEQYSIWPANKELPLGWHATGKTGTRTECLDYIEQVWTDMRPLSLRRYMEEQSASRKHAARSQAS